MKPKPEPKRDPNAPPPLPNEPPAVDEPGRPPQDELPREAPGAGPELPHEAPGARPEVPRKRPEDEGHAEGIQ
jgi:hypothetical protein